MGHGPGGGGDGGGHQGGKDKVADDVSGGNRGKMDEMEQRVGGERNGDGELYSDKVGGTQYTNRGRDSTGLNAARQHGFDQGWNNQRQGFQPWNRQRGYV